MACPIASRYQGSRRLGELTRAPTISATTVAAAQQVEDEAARAASRCRPGRRGCRRSAARPMRRSQPAQATRADAAAGAARRAPSALSGAIGARTPSRPRARRSGQSCRGTGPRRRESSARTRRGSSRPGSGAATVAAARRAVDLRVLLSIARAWAGSATAAADSSMRAYRPTDAESERLTVVPAQESGARIGAAVGGAVSRLRAAAGGTGSA